MHAQTLLAYVHNDDSSDAFWTASHQNSVSYVLSDGMLHCSYFPERVLESEVGILRQVACMMEGYSGIVGIEG